jgi:hypothetical protein
MNHARLFGLGLVTVGVLTLGLHAQTPSVPGAPGVPGGVPSAPAVPGGVPSVPGVPQQPSNIWSRLLPNKAQLAQCKEAFCKHPMGKMLANMAKPLTLYSGGMFNECCPEDKPMPSDLAQPATDPAGAAAAIKADEAGAKARRADMRYLGTVDCHYWPEAEAALIKGLRTDKNACVRWEAATSLGRGCCCTRKTIEALRITATGSDKDGHAAELSEWVKEAALKSLNHCVKCYLEFVPAETPREKPGPEARHVPASPMLPAYYAKLDDLPMRQIVEQARQALAQYQPPRGEVPIPTGRRTVTDIIAGSTGAEPPRPLPAAVAQAPGEGPIRPVAAAAPGATATRSPTAVPAAPVHRDLLHWWKDNFGSRPTAAAPRAAAPTAPAGAVPESATLPPTGNRGLFGVIRNSIGN